MNYLSNLKVKSLANVSPPVVALLISLLVVSLGLVVLWRLHVLAKFFASAGFQVTAFVLALLAIIFGCIQFWDSRRHSWKMQQVAESMSTRYIGVFPKDMDDIIKVVNLADQERLIMSDCADYGSYSRPETHQRFFDAVMRCSRKGSIRALAGVRRQACAGDSIKPV